MRHEERLNDLQGYYSLPYSGDPFEGKVIQLDKQAFDLLFQNYSNGQDEGRFRDKLERYDLWLHDKPYKVTENWLCMICKWMEKDK